MPTTQRYLVELELQQQRMVHYLQLEQVEQLQLLELLQQLQSLELAQTEPFEFLKELLMRR